MYNNQPQQPYYGGYNNGYNNPYGFNYGTPRPLSRNTQPLTQEQINKLRQNSDALDLKVDQEDLLRASCTHKEKNGESALLSNPDGTVTCDICKETFRLVDYSIEEVDAAINVIVDLLQTSKTIWLNAPDDVIVQYYQIIVLLKKFRQIWKRSNDCLSRLDMSVAQAGGVNQFGNGQSAFNALDQYMSSPYANPYGGVAPIPQGYNGYYGQPPMNQQMYAQAPMPPQQPVQVPQGYGQQPMPVMDPANNPMAYGTPGVGNQFVQQPAPVAPIAAPAPGVMPGNPQPAPAVVPQQPAAPADNNNNQEIQQQQTFNV